MKFKLIVVASVVLAGLMVVVPAQGTKWLHVRVVSANEDGDHVKVNVPVSLLEVVLPRIKADELTAGKIKIDNEELSVADLREIWAELKRTGNFEMARFHSKDQDVRVSLEGDFLIVRSSETSKENVSVTVPTLVLDALLQGPGDELDVLGAVKALSEQNVKELVSVNADDQTIRVWIDDSSTGGEDVGD